MKHLLFCLTFCAACGAGLSAQSICDTVYVWNFLDDHGKQTADTKKITTHFESSLTQYSECYVVDRREFSLFYEQNKNEQEVLNISDVDQYKTQLKTTQARIVVFGKIILDEISDVYVLTVKFQAIETGRVLRSSPLNIERAIMRDVAKLQTAIDKFVCNLIKGKACLGFGGFGWQCLGREFSRRYIPVEWKCFQQNNRRPLDANLGWKHSECMGSEY
jgi:hypothetical protein